MAGTYLTGETKVRPGTYFRIQETGNAAVGGFINGVTGIVFKSDWGPLNEAVEVSPEEGYEKKFGTALTTSTIREVFNGGAVKAVCCRVGSGGTNTSIKLQEEDGETDLVNIAGKYVGERRFSVTVRNKLSDDTKRECIIYSGTKEFEKVEFEKGGDEAQGLVDAFFASENFTVTKEANASGVLKDVSQAEFAPGTNPTSTVESYSNGFAAIEAYDFNTVCVDTTETAVHNLLSSFVKRIFQAGQMVTAVVAEKKSIPLSERMQHAAAYNSEKMQYVLNASVKNTFGETLEEYLTAARVAGMISSYPCNKSLTHGVLDGVVEVGERLTLTEINKAETMGCIVLSTNPSKQVWIDNAINTLITPADGQDEGWKKIRRTKTRYELITRANTQAEALVGRVDNDANGRATIVSRIQSVGTAMIEEGKLLSCIVSESDVYKADGDNAWFTIAVMDKDSAEHIYLAYQFKFSTQQEG